jgi:uncharacterized BrkB/YihY/UPF0761 family membrane protein
MPGGAEVILIGGLLVSLLFFLVWVALAYWVYKDANKRNMDNAILWAAITFLLGLIGLVIYLLVRE